MFLQECLTGEGQEEDLGKGGGLGDNGNKGLEQKGNPTDRDEWRKAGDKGSRLTFSQGTVATTKKKKLYQLQKRICVDTGCFQIYLFDTTQCNSTRLPTERRETLKLFLFVLKYYLSPEWWTSSEDEEDKERRSTRFKKLYLKKEINDWVTAAEPVLPGRNFLFLEN